MSEADQMTQAKTSAQMSQQSTNMNSIDQQNQNLNNNNSMIKLNPKSVNYVTAKKQLPSSSQLG